MSSPSVTLEKGAYRMGAPPRGNITHRRRATPTRSRTSAYLASLVVILALATITCFGTAYYLFTTRWDQPAVIHPSGTADVPVVQVIPYNIDSPPLSQDKVRYLAYLPHSGFHNQRIALENALTLSIILNRTLLIPPARLGNKPFRYMRSTTLRQFLILGGKEGLQHCARVMMGVPLPLECLEYFDFTHVSWEWLVGAQPVAKVVQRSNMTEEWLVDELGIHESETLQLDDTSAYHYRFLDAPTTTAFAQVPRAKFSKHIPIDDLAHSKKRLIHFGTLFGTTRLHLKKKGNVAIRAAVRRSMAFSNPFLVRVAEGIAEALGREYIGVHLRLGDGPFKHNATANARVVWWKLVHGSLGLSYEHTMELEGSTGDKPPPMPTRDAAALRAPHPPLPPLPDHSNLQLPCIGRLHEREQDTILNIPLFISTDVQHDHPAIHPFLKTFPCAFFLSDFPSQMQELKNLRNGYDGVSMEPFLIPFVDGMVVARAWAAVGTPGSTFSRFVEDVMWRVAHGWDVVSRG